ncbi:hypothetical protein TGGT1_217510 [Toxoplasma gondii GT1]|uniref:Inner membrane complex protein 19 n=5 Tax=Toxoplasma gondii TaxID=5811 RepID=S7V1I0_TOXGG|nr:hypothetical protein TGGT1_217510 [Toxoplasma gondii GT1]KAF4638334.1 hypothetical protein TGRH88_059410 [Toxoplasma gondii]KFH15869.1 hypothetical protein TGMAS_217510 [Toxoplasma gondii MAS]PIM04905.1 hypothetical protein TGCOUG_217510 [Toxoplasma gondii COUG]RQX71809.1 hypothetical protein TGCAST_217510 [Toxoplasma gondii CAST]
MSTSNINPPRGILQPKSPRVRSTSQQNEIAASYFMNPVVKTARVVEPFSLPKYLFPLNRSSASSARDTPRKHELEINTVQSILTTTPPLSVPESVIDSAASSPRCYAGWPGDSAPSSPRSVRWQAAAPAHPNTSAGALAWSTEPAKLVGVPSFNATRANTSPSTPAAPISDSVVYCEPLQTAEPQPLLDKSGKVFTYDEIYKKRQEFLDLTGVAHPEQHAQRTPAKGSYLEHYPVPPPLDGHNFSGDALLRSRLNPSDPLSYRREQGNPGHPEKFYHNDLMLDNIMIPGKMGEICPGTVSSYVDVPNFGRMQGLFAKQADGTVYPLITLPKMTPHDIFKTLDRMKAQRRNARRRNPLQALFCCQIAETEEEEYQYKYRLL